MDQLKRDLWHALRSFRRSPGLVTIASVSLALGIAVNVTMFAGVNSLLWRPLGYPDRDRLVQVWQIHRERGWDRITVSVPDFLNWRERTRTALLAAYAGGSFNFAEGERPERVAATRVSGDFLDLLGAPVVLGRRLGRADETPGAERSVVLSHRFWTARFDADSTLPGRAILLDGEPYTVVGLLGPTFQVEGERPADLFVPLVADPSARRGERFLRVVGRLAPAASIGALGAELDRITAALAAEFPQTNASLGARVIPLIDEVVEEPARRAAGITLVAVAFVLLIACANVANLLLARATGRERELAVRSALGAGRHRLIRELLTESLLLAGIGGLAGLGLSFVGIGWLRSIIPSDFPRVELLGIDWQAFAYAALITVGSGLGFGVAPAWRASRPDLVTSLRDGARGMTGLRHGRMLSTLVGVEIALALVLLIAAGLLIKGSLRVTAGDLGFGTRTALAFRTALAPREYPDSAAVIRFQEQLGHRLAALDGVDAAGGVSLLPLDGGRASTYQVEGEPEPREGEAPAAQVRAITPGYLDAIGIGVVGGRDVLPTDRLESPPVILVNEAMVRRHWANDNPLGRRIRMQQVSWEVVGVVRDVKEFASDEPAPPMVFFPAAQNVTRTLSYVLRTRRDPILLAEPVRALLAELAPNQPIYEVETLAQHIAESTARARIMPQLLTVFGAMALVMAIVGVYGVMAYSVAQRTQEMGVRRALGAPGRSILGLVMRQALVVSVLGGVVGLGLAAMTTRGLGFFLYGVNPFDPAIFGGITAALLGAAIAASAIPARRASRVDPVVALRAD